MQKLTLTGVIVLIGLVIGTILGVKLGKIYYNPHSNVHADPEITFRTNIVTINLEDGQFRELLRLRGEVGILRSRLAKLDSLRSTDRTQSLKATPVNTDTNQSYYYPISTWTNLGFATPQDSALTFLWALKQGNMDVYTAALNKSSNSIEQFPVEWGSAFQNVVASTISDVTQSAGENPSVSIMHQFPDGSTVTTWLQFQVVDGSWLIARISGYPIGVVQVANP
jgi:hypothetical protein